MNVLLVDPEHRLPPDLGSFLGAAGWAVDMSADYAGAVSPDSPPDAVIVQEPQRGGGPAALQAFRNLVRTAASHQTATLVLSPDPCQPDDEECLYVDVAAAGVSKEEIRGRLWSILRYHRLVRGMDRELRNMRRLSERLNRDFTEWDQEMRLAGRLQRDFLPRLEGPIGPVRFATLFRPASWVSGDIFDIYRVDEDHVAFYVADAVGHGVAASLLTMFIKKAVASKRISGDTYQVLTPEQTMQGLNEALAGQQLPNCQFVTACYCLFNLRTMELQCCRGGHPYPYHIERDGTLHELKSAGGLLGLFPAESYPIQHAAMKPGEKIIVYSDGLELAFCPEDSREDEFTYYRQAFRDLARMPADEIVRQLDDLLNDEHGSLNPRDDITVVVMEITDP